MTGKIKELALCNLAIDNKLSACDLLRLLVQDVSRGGKGLTLASVNQQKTHEPIRVEPTDPTPVAIAAWIGRPARAAAAISSQAGSMSPFISRSDSPGGS